MEASLVRVYASGNAFDGKLTKGRLEAEGIDVILKGEGEGPYHAGPVYLWVAREDEELARDVIDAIATGAYAMTDAEFEAQATGSANVTDEQPQR
jgi:hypothetical protein